jgi:hypothetical protein
VDYHRVLTDSHNFFICTLLMIIYLCATHQALPLVLSTLEQLSIWQM